VRIVTAYESVYTLVLMALDRYLAIVHPIGSIGWRTVSKTAIVMAVTWVIINEHFARSRFAITIIIALVVVVVIIIIIIIIIIHHHCGW